MAADRLLSFSTVNIYGPLVGQLHKVKLKHTIVTATKEHCREFKLMCAIVSVHIMSLNQISDNI